jgi:hypothetical protein
MKLLFSSYIVKEVTYYCLTLFFVLILFYSILLNIVIHLLNGYFWTVLFNLFDLKYSLISRLIDVIHDSV